MADLKHPHVVNLKAAEAGEPMSREHAEKYASRHDQVSRLIGAGKLGYQLTGIPPGKRAFPYSSSQVHLQIVGGRA